MVRKWVAILVLVLSTFYAWSTPAYADHSNIADADKPIQFGLTAVVIRENLRFLDQWSQYLSKKTGHRVEFVRRKSYREVMDLLDSGRIDFAWICGYPFVKKRYPEFIQMLSVPVYKGKPVYQSFIIVHKDSPYKTIEDLEDSVFAFSDPDSNSGYLFPQFLLASEGKSPEGHFRQTFFTYNHAETVEAVAEQVADGGAVDSYIWEYLQEERPELAGKTRVIVTSQSFGFPPLVARITADPAMVQKMKDVLLGMSGDPEGKKFLAGLKLDSFGESPSGLFDSIRKMASKIRKTQPWISAAEQREKETTAGKK